ncbi:protein phosphatase 2C domain-containing protein [Planotetraspora sp. A-T 1434]|uniref:protein phosphatase 2C domain-containing protein n=1 Tax=Planotetraspora sp. A-T 1434 TaxID=2979219 RepID=UPI0021C06F5B|nr:protein phosphatase 2C domain-containing protein [Planotetraspora sp. A-T 1434]MCT9934542.1 protein phosphatase 2C domain-containing protein [Planotetraspora sp. A-T 1434]
MEQVHEYAAAETAGDVPGIPEPLVIGRQPRLVSRPGPLSAVRRPDSEIDGAALPGLEVRAASLRGDAHRYYGTPRQDAMGLWHDGDHLLLACVADGLGSKEESHIGAATACEVAHANLSDFLVHAEPVTAARYFIENIADDINDRADKLQVAPDELSTTFCAAVVEELPEASRHRATIMRVGDCTAWRLHRGVWMPCFQEDEAEAAVATSATRALPRDVKHVEVGHADLYPGDMLLLCTDGLAKPMRAPQVSTQLSDWWRQGPPPLPEFFWQMSFRARTHDDDRTAVCLWRV